MKAFDTAELKGFMLSHLDKKAFRQGAEALDALMDDLIRYDIHFMRLTGVLDKDDDWGDSEYDEDDALEYIYDAYLGDHPRRRHADRRPAQPLYGAEG